jgi:hypothetical protein
VDEKAQIQALDRGQPLLPMRPGQAAPTTRPDGTTTLFANGLVSKLTLTTGRRTCGSH